MSDKGAAQAPARDTQGDLAALLIIDMINCFDFEGAESLMPRAIEASKVIEHLREEIEGKGWPVIYVNDNFGEWHSERSRIVERALAHDNPVSQRMKPDENDYFIIKPQFSGFYATNLPVLLPKLGVTRLILTGIATDICVLFTAADAHMRDYTLWVPADAVAAEDEARGRWALEIMAQSMGAQTAPTSDLTLNDWLKSTDERRS
jgi:nicotinamidase-related amidase